jgi:formylglycine-generating enzyme required for sulfatase activity/PKD repeat protein
MRGKASLVLGIVLLVSFLGSSPAFGESANTLAGYTDMAFIPAGSFDMGDSFGEADSNELPVHVVYVAAFYIDRFEETKALWDEVARWAAAHGYDIEPADGDSKGADHPVYNVSWYEAVKWANARSEKEGLMPCYTVGGTVYRTGKSDNPTCSWSANGYRLPTEAEWEKAARGGAVGHRFPWSDTDTIQHARANYFSIASYSYDTSPTRGNHPTYATGNVPYTSPVGSFAPNGYGLYDMAGNVWEWCWDWYSASYYGSSPGSGPRGPASGLDRVPRGGGWNDLVYARVAGRGNSWPGIEHSDLGFRLVRTVQDAPPTASYTWQALSSSGARLLVEPRTGDRIQFDASGSSDPDGRIVSYEWDWASDGTFETKVATAAIEHAFSTSGSQRVTLRVTDDQGATGSVTQTVNVGERQAPQALFTFSPTQPSVADAVQLTDQSSDPDGQLASWKWEFGDGTTSTDRNPSHTYSRKGTFTVKLTVTDNAGLTGAKTLSLTVVNLAPDTSFSFEPQTPVVGQSVRFDGSASTDRDGTITSYVWDFNGDGKTDAAGMEATRTFVEAKTYTVTLSVVDSDGATGTAKQDVVVSASPSGPPRFQEQWGLVIGVGNYEDPAIANLKYTEADAQAFYDFLTGTQGGGFQEDHVRFLLNEEATTASVKAAFRWLIGQAGTEDLVVIYFAGHGGTGEDVTVPPDEVDGVDEYLVTYDAQQADLFSTAVRDDEMADWLASFRCDNVVVILDSCFAAGATRSLEQTGTRAGPGNRVFNDLVGTGRLFLAASQEDEFSYEDAALGHGIFTYYLLRGLGAMEGVTTPEADADQDGRVTVEELRIYLEREVTRTKPQQHPLVTGDLALARVALDGYGEPLVGEVTAIQGDYVIISLGSRHGVQVGDRFEIVRSYTLPDGSEVDEVRALIQVAAILGPDRSACMLVESHFSVEIGDSVRPAQ